MADKVKYRDHFYVALADDKVGMKNKSRKELIAELKDKYDDEKELSKNNLKACHENETRHSEACCNTKSNWMGWEGKGTSSDTLRARLY